MPDFHFLTSVRFREIEQRTDGYDARRINLRVRDVVVTLDVIEVHSLRDAGLLIQIHQIALQIPIVDDAAQVTFEMAVINDVEANKRAKKSPVRFNNSPPEQISPCAEPPFEFIECLEKFAAGDFVWPLPGGETSSVNAVIYIVMQKTGELCVLGFDVFRKKSQSFVFREIIETIIEHSADVVLAIVEDAVCLFVPEHGDGHAQIEIRISCFVSFTQELKAADGVGRFEWGTRRSFASRVAKRPTFFIPDRIDYRHADGLFEPLQFPKKGGSTPPTKKPVRRKGDSDPRRRDIVLSHRSRPIHGTHPPVAEILRTHSVLGEIALAFKHEWTRINRCNKEVIYLSGVTSRLAPPVDSEKRQWYRRANFRETPQNGQQRG